MLDRDHLRDSHPSSCLATEHDFSKWCNEAKIPLLYIDSERPEPGAFVCFEKDYWVLKDLVPVFCLLKTIPNQIEYTQEKLRLTYETS